MTNSVTSFKVENIIGKSPVDSAQHGAPWVRESLNVQDAKICCGFVCNPLHSSDKRQHLGLLLGHLSVTSPLIVGGHRLDTILKDFHSLLIIARQFCSTYLNIIFLCLPSARFYRCFPKILLKFCVFPFSYISSTLWRPTIYGHNSTGNTCINN